MTNNTINGLTPQPSVMDYNLLQESITGEKNIKNDVILDYENNTAQVTSAINKIKLDQPSIRQNNMIQDSEDNNITTESLLAEENNTTQAISDSEIQPQLVIKNNTFKESLSVKTKQTKLAEEINITQIARICNTSIPQQLDTVGSNTAAEANSTIQSTSALDISSSESQTVKDKNMSQDTLKVETHALERTLAKENLVIEEAIVLQETPNVDKAQTSSHVDENTSPVATNDILHVSQTQPRNPHRDDGEWIWTTETCRKIAKSNNFLPQVYCRAVQKNIINRFFDFYLVGKRPKDLSVTDMVFAVISIMPTNLETEHFIFNVRSHTNHYHETGTLFSLPEEDIKLGDEELVKAQEYRETKEKEDANKLNGEGSNEQDQEQVDYDDEYYDDTAGGIYDFEDKNEADDDLASYYESEENKKKRIESEERTEIREGRLLYGPVKNAALIDTCRILLDDWDSYQDARIILKYFFGVVALTLMRAMTKTYKHLIDVFKNRFYGHVDYIRQEFHDFDFKYSVPHRKCVQACYMAFRERDEKTRVMFAKVLINMHDHISRGEDTNKEFVPKNWSIFMQTILNYTANYGWHIFNMFKRIGTRICSDYLDMIAEITHCDETAMSWQRIKDFEKSGNTHDKYDNLYHWARVVDENYFKHMSYEENYPLSIILLIFIEEIIMDSGVWKAKWIKEVKDVEKYIELGEKMYEQYYNKIEEFEEMLVKEHGKKPMKYVSSAFRGQY